MLVRKVDHFEVESVEDFIQFKWYHWDRLEDLLFSLNQRDYVIESQCQDLCVSLCLSVKLQNTLFRRSWRLLGELCPPNVAMVWQNVFFFQWFWKKKKNLVQQKNFCQKKHNGGVSNGRVCGCGWDYMISSQASHWSPPPPPSITPTTITTPTKKPPCSFKKNIWRNLFNKFSKKNLVEKNIPMAQQQKISLKK